MSSSSPSDDAPRGASPTIRPFSSSATLLGLGLEPTRLERALEDCGEVHRPTGRRRRAWLLALAGVLTLAAAGCDLKASYAEFAAGLDNGTVG